MRKDLVERNAELRIAVVDKEANALLALGELDREVAGVWVTQDSLGFAVEPAR